ncbi:hypothetical protein KCP76_19505 [Salmonella enterica subsp. enterica serovar Weltevreden]|nr:hypothetical protein KCP76_19505 [Salmonella enterica subsp. enterica serovar Weltevreden]
MLVEPEILEHPITTISLAGARFIDSICLINPMLAPSTGPRTLKPTLLELPLVLLLRGFDYGC